jgi:hypothetical protein
MLSEYGMVNAIHTSWNSIDQSEATLGIRKSSLVVLNHNVSVAELNTLA